MIGMIDMNTIDVIDNINPILLPENFISFEQLYAIELPIKDQYVNFNNLGTNLVDDLSNDIKQEIFANMLNYVNEKYLSVGDYDAAASSPVKLLETGNFIYNFICIDCYNTIIPNFLALTECTTFESFEKLIRIKYKNTYSILKANLIKVVKNIVEELLKLQKIDKSVQYDEGYNILLSKYRYYLDLVDFTDMEKFVEGYLIPLLVKNFDSVIWRIQ